MENKQTLKAFTLVEALITVAIFTLLMVSFYSVLSNGIVYILNSRNRVQAVGVANQEIEKLRNLAYDDVAVVGGTPPGLIPQDEDITVNGTSFHITRYIEYRDDHDDGLVTDSPPDAIPNDYKLVRVVISWGEGATGEKVELVSKFVPSGYETDPGGGILSVSVIDYESNPVVGADINIFNNNVEPEVDYDTVTDSDGNIFYGLEPDTNYQITLDKNGYEDIVTEPDPTGSPLYHPTSMYKHIIVVAGSLNERTIEINEESDLRVETVDPFGTKVANVVFDLAGGRVKGLEDGTGEEVYAPNDANGNHDSGLDGKVSFQDINPKEYTLSNVTIANYQFWKTSPGNASIEVHVTDPYKFILKAGIQGLGNEAQVDMILLSNLLDSLLVYIREDAGGGVPGDSIEGATVRVYDPLPPPNDYDETLLTDQYGKIFFPDPSGSETSLVNGTEYTIEVTATGYNPATDTQVVTGLETKEILLTIP